MPDIHHSSSIIPRSSPAGQAAVGRAEVWAGGERAEGAARRGRVEPFADQLTDHRDEGGVRADGRGANQVEAEVSRGLPRLGVEVVEHLHVVGDEADRRDYHVSRALRLQSPQVVEDVGFEPRLRGRPRTALEGEAPARVGAGIAIDRRTR